MVLVQRYLQQRVDEIWLKVECIGIEKVGKCQRKVLERF